MRALSLWQPWATLVAAGVKQYETRGWMTNYRGELAIHASKRWTKAEQQAWRNFHFVFPGLLDGLPTPPLGAVLCIVKLVDVVPTDKVRYGLSEWERAFGNYAPGRYAWKLEITEVLKVPIPASGMQGFWQWERP
jgi:hypothetical protein